MNPIIFLNYKLNNYVDEGHYMLSMLNNNFDKQYLMHFYHHSTQSQGKHNYHSYSTFFWFVEDYYHKLNIDLVLCMSYNHSYKVCIHSEFNQGNAFQHKYNLQYLDQQLLIVKHHIFNNNNYLVLKSYYSFQGKLQHKIYSQKYQDYQHNHHKYIFAAFKKQYM